MTIQPILFSAPMVRALLDGRKTMTRRVLKPTKGTTLADFTFEGKFGSLPLDKIETPRFAAGDLLWVRERLERAENHFVNYSADKATHPDAEWVWKNNSLPSIHCPKGMSRLTLEVTGVKVERLQDISEEEAKAEGIYFEKPTAADLEWYKNWSEENGDDNPAPMDGVWQSGIKNGYGPNAIFAFKKLWESINGEGSWAANPWVLAVSFKVHKCNVSAMA